LFRYFRIPRLLMMIFASAKDTATKFDRDGPRGATEPAAKSENPPLLGIKTHLYPSLTV
jgi:hypothetical protein